MMQSQSVVQVSALSKSYFVDEREGGFFAALQSLVRRKRKEVKAVNSISFELHPGEVVGFLGPNGAGKTTTLKMLSGLLMPTAGEVRVLGHEPWARQRSFLQQITLVMGQRNQLAWDIPAVDSYQLNQAIYDIPEPQFRETLDEFVELLELKDLIRKPVRNLSLGERMKVEIAAALLHRPQVLFLDEPTLGLDITMQRRIRTFIAEYNRRTGATVLLTSHYMADVEALCKRVIMIHHGRILFDGDLSDLVDRFSAHKTIVLKPETNSIDYRRYGEVVDETNGRIALKVPKADVSRVTSDILRNVSVYDLTVEDPPIEDVIEAVFAGDPD